MVNQIDPLLVPVPEAAKIIGIGRSKFYELVGQNRIPIVKIDGKSLVSVAALKEFAESLIKAA